jgi:hypothetical protein
MDKITLKEWKEIVSKDESLSIHQFNYLMSLKTKKKFIEQYATYTLENLKLDYKNLQDAINNSFLIEDFKINIKL